jgi:hypothetical protein
MNFPRLALAALFAWAMSLAVDYLASEILLVDLIRPLHATIMRSQAELDQLTPASYASSFVGFFVFTYVYAKGYEGGSGIQEGLRFGVLVGLLLVCFGLVRFYVWTPFPLDALLAFSVHSIVGFAIYGTLVGLVYRPLPSAVPRRSASSHRST